MERNVFININAAYSSPDGKYSTQTDTQGTMKLCDGGCELCYEEPADELEGSVTTLNISNDGLVTMTRTGHFTTEMVMEQGKRHVCHYMTPFGDMLMGIFAKKVESNLDENGGELHLHYTIDVNADLASTNELKITVK